MRMISFSDLWALHNFEVGLAGEGDTHAPSIAITAYIMLL